MNTKRSVGIERSASRRPGYAAALFALLFSLSVTWRAMAAGPSPSAPSDRSPEAAVPAGADARLSEEVQTSLESIPLPEKSNDQPVLYDPRDGNVLGPATGGPANEKPPPERSVYRHRVRVGSVALVVLAGDLPQPRGDWNDRLQPEMFQLYFEPSAESKAIGVHAHVPED